MVDAEEECESGDDEEIVEEEYEEECEAEEEQRMTPASSQQSGRQSSEDETMPKLGRLFNKVRIFPKFIVWATYYFINR